MRVLKAQQGVALIMVLLVVALVTISAVEMGARLQLQVKRTSSIKDANQAYWYAIAAEQYAQKTISQLVQEKGEPIHINQPWAQEGIQFPMPNGSIEATLEDMRSCFNLNALQRGGGDQEPTELINGFHRLLQTDTFNIPPLNADTVKDSLVDWLDADGFIYGSYGAEDADYESLVHPYLAANTMMANKSELRLVQGVELPWLLDIMPMVCAIPNENEFKLNVNTLTPERAPVLAAVTGISVSDAENLISNIPYDTVDEFANQAELQQRPLTDPQKAWFDVRTKYFILHVKTTYNNASFKMSSVFEVQDDDTVSLIRREFGGSL